MGASAAATIQHFVEDPQSIVNAGMSTFTAGGSDLYRKQKEGEEMKEEAKKKGQAAVAEAQQRKEAETANAENMKKRTGALAKQRSARLAQSGRQGTILTSPLGEVGGDQQQRRTLLGG